MPTCHARCQRPGAPGTRRNPSSRAHLAHEGVEVGHGAAAHQHEHGVEVPDGKEVLLDPRPHLAHAQQVVHQPGQRDEECDQAPGDHLEQLPGGHAVRRRGDDLHTGVRRGRRARTREGCCLIGPQPALAAFVREEGVALPREPEVLLVPLLEPYNFPQPRPRVRQQGVREEAGIEFDGAQMRLG